MEFNDLLKARRSIRGYQSEPVSDSALAKIAEAVSLAPSACNRQPWKMLAVRDAGLRKKICAACPGMKFLAEAPVILVGLGAATAAWSRPGDDHPIYELDHGIMFEHAVLAAANEGLGTCWVCCFKRADMDAAVGIGAPWTVLAVSPLGYAAQPPTAFTRKPIAETFEII